MKADRFSGTRWRKRRQPFLTIFVAALLATITAGVAHSAVSPRSTHSQAPGDPHVLQTLVMGDSYSAGNGAGGYVDVNSGCWRSPNNYGGQYRNIMEAAPNNQPTSVNIIACSGDRTNDVLHPSALLRGHRPPQLAVLKNAHYDVIFLTIGGNDLKFDTVIKFCMIDISRISNQCDRALKFAERQLTKPSPTLFSPIEVKIATVLRQVAKFANTDAKIVLVGYPLLEGDVGYQLLTGASPLHRRAIPPPILVGQRVRAGGTTLDDQEAEIVDTLNAGNLNPQFAFESVQAMFEGPPDHELHAGAAQVNPIRWMMKPFVDNEPPNFDLPNFGFNFYHPNPTGWLMEA